jgi:putative DNA primase/helicase
LKEPVEQDEMLKVEDVNRRIAHALGGDFNSIDAARILRIPGTINHKYPAPVQITQLNDFHYSLDDFLDILPKIDIKKDGVKTKSINSNESKIIMRCDFIKFCRNNPEQVPEPLWYAMISNLISVRPGGVALCHTLSKGHSKYTRKETDQKIIHALNSSRPLSCSFIRENGFDCEKSCHVISPAGLLFDDSYYDEGDRVNVEPQIKVSFR